MRSRERNPIPLLLPGALYSREQIIAAFGISEDTIARWKKAGLPIRKPGTQRAVIFADELMEIIRLLTD